MRISRLTPLLLLILCGCPDIALEWDEVNDFNVPTSYSWDGKTIEDIFDEVDLDLEVIQGLLTLDQIPDSVISEISNNAGVPIAEVQGWLGDPEAFCEAWVDGRFDPGEEYVCMSEASIHQLVQSTRDHEPPPSLSNVWYAHGLTLPCCWDEIRGAPCTSYNGLIWLPLEMDLQQIRRDYVSFYCQMDGDDARLGNALHEFSHVLNLDHCEILGESLETLRSFGTDGTAHLKDHERNEVRPGEMGTDWCDHSTEHLSTHAGCLHDCLAGFGDLVTAAAQDDNITLRLIEEKDVYEPGELIRVTAVLQPGSKSLRSSQLDPLLGHLRLWVGESEDSLQPLPVHALAEIRGEEMTVEGTIVKEGIDLWYGLPDAVADDSFIVVATFTGFADSSVAVVSHPLPIRLQPAVLGSQTRQVLQLFKRYESREFLKFLGGDHLQIGRTDLEAVASRFTGSVYASYANLALGANLTIPFHHHDETRNSIEIRVPDPDAASVFLDAVIRDHLPLSYQFVLDRAQAKNMKRLAEKAAPTDPERALQFYERAATHLKGVITHAPPDRDKSTNEKRAEAHARSTLRDVQSRMEALTNSP